MSNPSLRAQFEQLSTLDPDSRATALEAIARSDANRAERLRVMLAADLDPLIEEPPLRSIADALSGSLLELRHKALDAIGFVPQRLLGSGGMGEVWLVERTVAGRSQLLALKLLQAGVGSAESWLARFRTEQRILLELDHPGIARLVDAGEAEGQPWIAMEFVDGGDVIGWCDSRQLDLQARLRLFQQICAAVQYAHDRLIVHRDLKPANVLVNSRGEPKLLDFGIAKILDDNDPASFRTGTAQQLFSLYGVTPEQLRGEAPTVATDVYALGSLLYDLLSGCKALDFEGLGLTGIEQRVLHESPSLPSQVVSAEAARNRGAATVAALARELRGDLDRIVLHALRKRASERYASVRDFSTDIGRYLSGQPVLAAGQGRAYRLGKFLRRHRIGAIVALTVVALMLAFIVQLRLERNAAERARDGAQRVSEFLIKMFELGDPTRSLAREISAAEMLEQGFKQLDEQQLDARTGAPVLLAMAQASRGLGDPALAAVSLRALERSRPSMDPQQRIEADLIALDQSRSNTESERVESLTARLRSYPKGDFSQSQSERLELFEIESLVNKGQHRVAVERMRKHAPWSPSTEANAFRVHASALSVLQEYAQVEALLQPISERLETVPSKVLDLVTFLRFRATAAAKLKRDDLALTPIGRADSLVKSRFGAEHLVAAVVRVTLADVLRDLNRQQQGISILTEIVPRLDRLPLNHNVRLIARHNLIIMLGEFVDATPKQLELGRAMALDDLANPAIQSTAMRARYRISLIRMDVIGGHPDRALSAVLDYRRNPLPELSDPVRQAQLEGWELVLAPPANPDPARIRELLEIQHSVDLLLQAKLEAMLRELDPSLEPASE